MSLRRKSKMIESLSKCPHSEYDSEDLIFSTCTVNRIPSKEIARRFAVETQYNTENFGVHAVWKKKYVSPEHLKALKERCKGLDKLEILNNEYIETIKNSSIKVSDLKKREKSKIEIVKGRRIYHLT